MHIGTAELDAPCNANAGPKGNGKHRLLTLDAIDRRTAAYKRTRELIDAIEADLGGADQISAAARQLVQHAAVHGALLEDQAARWLDGEPIDAATFATLSNAQRRLFETVGIKRVPRDVTDLRSYLETRNRAPAQQHKGNDQ